MKFHDNKIVIAKCPACHATTKVTLEPGRAAIHCPRCKQQLPLAFAHSYHSQPPNHEGELAAALRPEKKAVALEPDGGSLGANKKQRASSAQSTDVEYPALNRGFTRIALWIGSGFVVAAILALAYLIWQKPVLSNQHEYLINVRESVEVYRQTLDKLRQAKNPSSRGESLKQYHLLKGRLDYLEELRIHLMQPQDNADPEFTKLLDEMRQQKQSLATLEKELGLEEKRDVAKAEPVPTKTEPTQEGESKQSTASIPVQTIPKVTDTSTILVILPGVTANQVNDLFLKRFAQLCDRSPGQVTPNWAGDLLTLEIKPVANPATYATKIDFGKLIYLSLADRSITLQLDSDRVTNTPNVASDPLTTILADLKQRDKVTRLLPALNRLSEIKPDHRQAEVTALVVALINERDMDLKLREPAIKLLPVWAGRDAIPSLEKWMDDKSAIIRWAALDSLVELRATGSAAVIVKHWTKADAERTSRALITLGPEVETSVLPFLNNSNETLLRMEACKVLKQIGTTQSLKPLLDVINAKDQPAAVVNAAKDAMQGILGRDK